MQVEKKEKMEPDRPEGGARGPVLPPEKLADIRDIYREAETKPNFVERVKNQLALMYSRAQEAINKLLKKSEKNKETNQDLIKKGIEPPKFLIDDDPKEPESLSHMLAESQAHVKEIWSRLKANPAKANLDPDSPQGKLLHRLLESIPTEQIQDAGSVVLAKLLRAVLVARISNPLAALATEEVLLLFERDPGLARKIKDAILSTAKESGQPPEEIQKFADETNPEKVAAAAGGGGEGGKPPKPPENPANEEENNELEQRSLAQALHDATYRQGEFGYLLDRVRDNQKLTAVSLSLVTRKHFLDYVFGSEEFGDGLKAEIENTRRAELQQLAVRRNSTYERELWKAISREYSDRIVELVGWIHNKIDESNPKDFWETVAREGGMFNTDDNIFNFIKTKLENLANSDLYTDSRFEAEAGYAGFFFRESRDYDRRTPLRPYDKERAQDPHLSEDERRATEMISEPFFEDLEAENSRQYIKYILNRAKNHIDLRKALHNAVALKYQPKEEGGIFAQMEKYVKTLLPSTALDDLLDQPDVEAIYAASAMEDKIMEAQMAKYHWLWQQQLDADVERGMSIRDVNVMDRLKLIIPHWDQRDADWKAARALRMAIGDLHAISLRWFEHGARAHPPRSLRKAGDADYSSYGPGDADLFMALYPQMHFNQRWAFDETTIGNLIFLKVEGDDLRQTLRGWDHREVMRDMHEAMRAYTHGRRPYDVGNNTMRFVDWVNPAGVGSIYTRGGWRMIHAYEAHLDLAQPKLNIVDSVKNIEGIGLEVMKDFMLERIKGFNDTFYKAAGASERRALVEYLVPRYLHGQDPGEVFDKLEKAGAASGVEAQYKTFYYRVFAGAIARRMPTKFIRMETPREAPDRYSGYEIVRDAARANNLFAAQGLSHDQYEDEFFKAVCDITSMETKLRMDTTAAMRERVYTPLLDQGKRLHELTPAQRQELVAVTSDYNLTREKLAQNLRATVARNKDGSVDELRVNRALAVYDEIHNFIGGEDVVGVKKDKKTPDKAPFLDAFAKRYQRGFPFAIGSEELERTLLAYKGIGEQGPKRALKDVADVEGVMVKVMQGYFDVLMGTATSGKKEFGDIIEALHHAHHTLTYAANPAVANKFVHHMAGLTLKFFMKDTSARGLFQSIASYGRVNSLVGEFVGPNRHVWEWEVSEANAFITALEERFMITRFGFGAGHRHAKEKPLVSFTIPGINKKIELFKRTVFEKDMANEGPSADDLRAEFGVSNKQMIWELTNKYLPMVMIFLLYNWIKSALDEDES